MQSIGVHLRTKRQKIENFVGLYV